MAAKIRRILELKLKKSIPIIYCWIRLLFNEDPPIRKINFFQVTLKSAHFCDKKKQVRSLNYEGRKLAMSRAYQKRGRQDSRQEKFGKTDKIWLFYIYMYKGWGGMTGASHGDFWIDGWCNIVHTCFCDFGTRVSWILMSVFWIGLVPGTLSCFTRHKRTKPTKRCRQQGGFRHRCVPKIVSFKLKMNRQKICFAFHICFPCFKPFYHFPLFCFLFFYNLCFLYMT